jgi:hypothetical protein
MRSYYLSLGVERKRQIRQVLMKRLSGILGSRHGQEVQRDIRLEESPIVQDYPEVFPEDLPGLPPTR